MVFMKFAYIQALALRPSGRGIRNIASLCSRPSRLLSQHATTHDSLLGASLFLALLIL